MTDNPADVSLTKEQVETIADGGVLMLEHGECGQPFRLWMEPQEGQGEP